MEILANLFFHFCSDKCIYLPFLSSIKSLHTRNKTLLVMLIVTWVNKSLLCRHTLESQNFKWDFLAQNGLQCNVPLWPDQKFMVHFKTLVTGGNEWIHSKSVFLAVFSPQRFSSLAWYIHWKHNKHHHFYKISHKYPSTTLFMWPGSRNLLCMCVYWKYIKYN